MSKTILVVGATGTVGTSVAETLAKRGHRVRAATRDPSKVKGAEGVRFDFGDASTFHPALEGAEAVFLLSPVGHANSHGLVAPFLGEATRSGARIVTMTAAGVEYDDSIPLRKIELDVERSGAPHVFLRPSWFNQNFETYWYSTIQSDGVIALPAADSKTTFIDARDIGEAAAVALTSPAHLGKAYTLTGPEALTYAEAAAILSEVAGRTIRYESIDDARFGKALAAAGLPPDYAGLLTALFGFVRQGAASQVDPSLAAILGRAPRSLKDYARDHAQKFRRS